MPLPRTPVHLPNTCIPGFHKRVGEEELKAAGVTVVNSSSRLGSLSALIPLFLRSAELALIDVFNMDALEDCMYCG